MTIRLIDKLASRTGESAETAIAIRERLNRLRIAEVEAER